jgi:hypothetical protein
LVEDILRLVSTLNLPFAVVGLQCITLNDKERVIIISRHLRSFPREAVNIAVSVPLSDNGRTITLNHIHAVNNEDNRPVSLRGATAHVHDSKVAVGYLYFIIIFRLRPNPQLPLPILLEAEIFKSLFPLITIGIDIPDKARRTAGFLKFLHLVLVKDHSSRMNERLHIVRWKLGSHDRVAVLTASLLHIPIDCLQPRTFLP